MMAFERVCAAADLGEGDMAAFYVEGVEVLVVRDKGGEVRAMDGICPHEDFPLVHGDFDGTVLYTATGRGINPPSSRLEQFAVKVDGDAILVDPDAGP